MIEVLCLTWNTKLSFDSNYQFVEVFAGKGRVSQKMRLCLDRIPTPLNHKLQQLLHFDFGFPITHFQDLVFVVYEAFPWI